MMKYVLSPSLGPVTLGLTCMNLVCGLWPRCEVHLFSSSTVNQSLVHELRVSTNAIPFLYPTDHLPGVAQYTEPG